MGKVFRLKCSNAIGETSERDTGIEMMTAENDIDGHRGNKNSQMK